MFGKVLMAELKRSGALAGTCTDPKRRLEIGDYLGLFLFGQLNPVVDSMQGLCAASQFKRVQEQVCGSAVSLGSFSEARALVEPQLLERVFENLVSQCARKPQKGLEGRELLAIESTLWRVVRRMDWAYWRTKSGKHGGPDHAVRLHVHFDLSRGCVSKGQVEKAAECERKNWCEMARWRARAIAT